VLDPFEVTGHIDGLNNKGLLPTGENQPVYHETITRVEIERMGVSSFEELFRYIPQTTSGENGFQAAVNNVNTSGGTSSNVFPGRLARLCPEPNPHPDQRPRPAAPPAPPAQWHGPEPHPDRRH